MQYDTYASSLDIRQKRKIDIDRQVSDIYIYTPVDPKDV